MKILSMTATFGKLENQTLTLHPGLNVLEAPNEWGKSTWCAFLMAMLYGIDTSQHTTKTSLADKAHYQPWSGAPMSGRMDILWKNRAITIERQSKGKTPFGIFRAYETESGLEVTELTSENCGQTLLGVERSVFQRSGFLKLTDLPMKQDEALQRRLNNLVTTGDESNTGDTLGKKLKDLKNHCRFNKKGLLPQAEGQKEELLQALRDLAALQEKKQQYIQEQHTLSREQQDLENHLQALLYSANLTYSQKLSSAQVARDAAAQALQLAEDACKDLPDPKQVQTALNQLDALQQERNDLHFKSQTMTPAPAMPADPEVFRGMTPEQAVRMAAEDADKAATLEKSSGGFPAMGLIITAIGAILTATIDILPVRIGGALVAAVGIAVIAALSSRKKKFQRQLTALLAKYRGADYHTWEASAQEFAATKNTYDAALAQREKDLQSISAAFRENETAEKAVTGGISPSQFRQNAVEIFEKFRILKETREQYFRAEELLQALSSSHKTVEPPKYQDHLTCSEAETRKLLGDTQLKIQQLKELVGKCQGQMLSYGDEAVLQKKLSALDERIETLEDTYAALEIALKALESATQELQRRFAPRISQRAQELLSRLTGGRYQRLILDSNFVVHTGAADEVNLQTPLWRSEGTADQLYLALRLAVAEELTPDAPLVLDDTLVRFDDTRLAAAMDILKETAENKQVIVFTCQSRESAHL